MPLVYATEQDGALSPLPPPLQLFLLTEGVTIQAALTLVTHLGIADLLADGPQTSEALARETYAARLKRHRAAAELRR
jgi:hypothetical protein